MKDTKTTFESERKQLCTLLSIRLRNPKLSQEERQLFLKKLEKLVTELPSV